jgi:hypothetical protein
MKLATDFMFHSLEFNRTDSVTIFGSVGDYSVEVTIETDGIKVEFPDRDEPDTSITTGLLSIDWGKFLEVE